MPELSFSLGRAWHRLSGTPVMLLPRSRSNRVTNEGTAPWGTCRTSLRGLLRAPATTASGGQRRQGLFTRNNSCSRVSVSPPLPAPISNSRARLPVHLCPSLRKALRTIRSSIIQGLVN